MAQKKSGNGDSSTDGGTSSNVVEPEVLQILRCPLTHSKLRQEGDFLVAEVGGLRYPVRDGIPVMLIEEAQLPPDVSSIDELRAKYGPKG